MESPGIARALHVLAVILWIGVAMVTTVLLPAVQRHVKNGGQVEFFERLEPLFLHRRLIERSRRDPSGTFALIQSFHWVLLVFSLITVFGAVAGSHGYL